MGGVGACAAGAGAGPATGKREGEGCDCPWIRGFQGCRRVVRGVDAGGGVAVMEGSECREGRLGYGGNSGGGVVAGVFAGVACFRGVVGVGVVGAGVVCRVGSGGPPSRPRR